MNDVVGNPVQLGDYIIQFIKRKRGRINVYYGRVIAIRLNDSNDVTLGIVAAERYKDGSVYRESYKKSVSGYSTFIIKNDIPASIKELLR